MGESKLLPVSLLTTLFEPKVYVREATVIYKGQIPPVAFLLLSGEAHSFGGRKPQMSIEPYDLIGFEEFLRKSPSRHNIRIVSNSEVCIIDRSTIKETLQSSPSPLTHFFVNYLDLEEENIRKFLNLNS